MKILVVTDYYIPAFRAGGQVRALATLLDALKTDFQFLVITKDRDQGSDEPFQNIRPGQFQDVGGASVYYMTPRERSPVSWLRLLRKLNVDLYYLNGFFAWSVIWILLAHKLQIIPRKPVLLAPRGALLRGNVTSKGYKKLPFIALSRAIRLHSGFMWQAASSREIDSFRMAFPRELADAGNNVYVAPDLPDLPPFEPSSPAIKKAGYLRLAFLGRIAREKNLHVALRLITRLTGHVEYNIYGPVDNAGYWQECQRTIADLPVHIQVHYHGAIPPDQVLPMFRQHHALLFPVRGESFSWTIFEALYAGCPVLTSDQTPWQDLESHACGWVVPLDQPSRFVDHLKSLLNMDQAAFERHSRSARAYALAYLGDSDPVAANRQMFNAALSRAAR